MTMIGMMIQIENGPEEGYNNDDTNSVATTPRFSTDDLTTLSLSDKVTSKKFNMDGRQLLVILRNFFIP
eukprot:CAMPEP_0194203946 /NCGR_PEP_ID=MMETSP0156-20130528/3586_1 /TAXON_ID=33649 /ORGANISM="Thalassionema nitzschioides, Strain L26-B" /LENGTH=68 /DNA_ID=CAMNT_0038929809 /DNA_START=93 /DNA_END=295 /DNA_ORIENTATION=-